MIEQTRDITQPRFEFRIFGRDLSTIRDGLVNYSSADDPPVQSRKSSELYILSKTNDTCNCKIRDQKIDIKSILSRKDGLEQWDVILKAEFPLSRRTIVKEVFPALWTRAPLLKDGDYNLNQTIEILGKHPDLQLINVDKVRYGYLIENTICEFARVFVNGAMIQTVGVESAVKNDVIDAIKKLGIDGYENLNYQKAIKRIIGWEGLKTIE